VGECNDLALLAAPAGIELGFRLAGVDVAGGGGVQEAMKHFAEKPAR
jgi:alanine-glyoxylate transaminase/serine-glyoxylate transaminase/serine-pyruvate transaminase